MSVTQTRATLLVQAAAGAIAATLIAVTKVDRLRMRRTLSLVIPLLGPALLLTLLEGKIDRAAAVLLPILCIYALATTYDSLYRLGRHVRSSLRVYIWITAPLLVASPDLMLAPAERSSRALFGFESRLVGPSGGPQYMGILMALSVLFEARKARRMAELSPYFYIALIFCFWTQSRTSISLVLLGLAVMLFARRHNLETMTAAYYRSSARRSWYPYIAILLLITPLILMPFMSPRLDSILNHRGSIWQTMLRVYIENPVTGYGSALFTNSSALSSPEFALLGISNAHSQLLQSLAMFGVVGALGSIVYVLNVAVLSSQLNEHTAGAAMALSLLVIAQTMFSAPLNMFGLSFNLIPNVVLVTFLVSANAQRESPIRHNADSSAAELPRN